MSFVTDALHEAIHERLNEILVPMTKSSDISPSHSEIQEAMDEFRMKIADDPQLADMFDDLMGLIWSYSFEENKACYLSGIRDFRAVFMGNTDLLSEKEG